MLNTTYFQLMFLVMRYPHKVSFCPFPLLFILAYIWLSFFKVIVATTFSRKREEGTFPTAPNNRLNKTKRLWGQFLWEALKKQVHLKLTIRTPKIDNKNPMYWSKLLSHMNIFVYCIYLTNLTMSKNQLQQERRSMNCYALATSY